MNESWSQFQVNRVDVSRHAARIAGAGAWTAVIVAAIALSMSVASRGSEPDRSPVDLAVAPDESWLVTANQTSGSISLVSLVTDRVLTEVACGASPSSIAISPDGGRVLVTAAYGGALVVFERSTENLVRKGEVTLGFEPRGVVVTPDGKRAYVALAAASAVAEVDLHRLEVMRRINVGRWPRTLALSPDGARLAVGASGDGGIAVVDVHSGELLYTSKCAALNIGQMQTSRDGRYVYFPWMAYGETPITKGNIRRGWVLANRLARVALDGEAHREAITLDPSGEAAGDPVGLALTPDEQWMVVTASGTQELLVFRMSALAFQQNGGPGDTMDPALAADRNNFFRVALGGRPMSVRMARDGHRVFVANYLSNTVQVVDLDQRAVARTIHLGGAPEPGLARRGEAIFYDARRSFEHWYSCHSCHYEGGTNRVTMDTRNDGSFDTYKTVLSLRGVAHTGPWTWHGWQTDLEAAMRKSINDTMQAPPPSDDDVRALIAYLDTVPAPPNPFVVDGASLADSVRRGQAIFESTEAACATCHEGPLFTDGKIHDVGLGSRDDKYQGFNTPSLVGLYQRVLFLHDGRAKSLEDLLSGPHSPQAVSGTRALSDAEIRDLVVYLRTL